jgi:hypothetical protein
MRLLPAVQTWLAAGLRIATWGGGAASRGKTWMTTVAVEDLLRLFVAVSWRFQGPGGRAVASGVQPTPSSSPEVVDQESAAPAKGPSSKSSAEPCKTNGTDS